jgi:hypothetical protein
VPNIGVAGTSPAMTVLRNGSNMTGSSSNSTASQIQKPSNKAPFCVTRGLDPRVHLLRKKLDCRVKPGNDAVFCDAVVLNQRLCDGCAGTTY